MLTDFLRFTALCTVSYYLFARAEVTRWAWRRYPKWLDRLAVCAACSGWWIGGIASFYAAPPLLYGAHAWERLFSGAVWGLLLTPVGTALLLYALAVTAPVAPEDPNA